MMFAKDFGTKLKKPPSISGMLHPTAPQPLNLPFPPTTYFGLTNDCIKYFSTVGAIITKWGEVEMVGIGSSKTLETDLENFG